jgi:hypothetical protein
MPEVYIIHHTDGHNKESKNFDSRFQVLEFHFKKVLGHPVVPASLA